MAEGAVDIQSLQQGPTVLPEASPEPILPPACKARGRLEGVIEEGLRIGLGLDSGYRWETEIDG
ncbi:MAG: hypothetical protein OXH20_04740 [bacterium]|nr:hypothetical protein [bacterium]MDE0668650.1 hypothetical protein [bacterium]MYE67125.1 hypothetical protein [Acidimicrobiia bacterium]